MADKMLVEKHLCRICKKTFQIVVYEENCGFDSQDLAALRKDGIIPIKKGADIVCPHCKKELCVA